MDKKDKIIGVLLAVIAVSLIAISNPTGQVIKERTTGFIEVNPEISTGVVDIYVDGRFIETVDYRDYSVPYKVSAGEHLVVVKSEGFEDYLETVIVTVGKTTKIRAFYELAE